LMGLGKWVRLSSQPRVVRGWIITHPIDTT
jgi:hypothetical protein